MNKERMEYYAHFTVTVIGVCLFAYIFVKHLFLAVLPFLIAWGVAFAIRPLAHRISKGIGIPHKVVSVTLTVLIVIGGLSVLVSALAYAVGEAWNFLTGLAESDRLYSILEKLMNPIGGFLGDHEGAAELEAKISEALKSTLTSLLSSLLESVTSFVSSVPRVLIFTLVTVIAAVYFSLDLEKINEFVKKSLPKKASGWLVNFKNSFLTAILKYLRSYLIIMLITFIIMLFGFLVLGVKYSVLFAFLVALLDALPLIGVGTVLVPWSVYQIIFGSVWQGVGLLILLAVHEVIRQFAEPKIVGKNMGIHPIISLILLYLGYFFFGFFGLLLIPLLTVVINILSKGENRELKEK